MSEETVAERVAAGETVTDETGNSDKHAPARDTLHHIVVVGGGAAGLELATGLGDKLGKRKTSEYHADRAVAHPSVEAAAARGRRREHERR